MSGVAVPIAHEAREDGTRPTPSSEFFQLPLNQLYPWSSQYPPG